MDIIANENMPMSVVDDLRNHGHDVLYVKESMPGAEDDVILLARAQNEQRLVITQDKDFGELAFRFGLPASCGVVLFRLSGDSPQTDQQRMVSALESRTDWAGHFAVVEDARIRIRPLP